MIGVALACLFLGLVTLPDWNPGDGRHRNRRPAPLAGVALVAFGASVLATLAVLHHWPG